VPTVSEILEREFPDEYARMSDWRVLLAEVERCARPLRRVSRAWARCCGSRARLSVRIACRASHVIRFADDYTPLEALEVGVPLRNVAPTDK